MQIRIRIQGDCLDVQARGVLTAEAAAELLSEVRKELAPRPRDVALDLGQIDSISAGALPFVFRVQQQVQQTQRQLTVTALSSPVRRLFALTGVDEHLDGVTREAALSNP